MLLDSLKWILLVLYICYMSCILFVDRNRYRCVCRVPILKKLGKCAIARVLLANNDLRNDPCSSYVYCCPAFCRNRLQKVKNRSSPNWRKHWRRWRLKRQNLVKATRSAIWWCRNPADCFTAIVIFLLKEIRFTVIFPSIDKVSTSHAYQCPMMTISLVRAAADLQSVNEVWIRWVVEYYSSFLHFREE